MMTIKSCAKAIWESKAMDICMAILALVGLTSGIILFLIALFPRN
jgi:hypothetical protein